MKNIIFIFLIIGTLFSLNAEAKKKPIRKDYNCYWELSKDGVLTISGQGKMPNIGFKRHEIHTPWRKNKEKINKIIIEEGIQKVGNFAFYGCTNVSEIILPQSLEDIGENAFYCCRGFKNIKLPNGLKSIGKEAFYGCTKLESITIPHGIKTIERGTFENCI